MEGDVEGMSGSRDRLSLPPDRPPWDPWNGARIGVLVGGTAAFLGVWISGWDAYWVTLVGAALGGGAGYRSEARKLHKAPPGE